MTRIGVIILWCAVGLCAAAAQPEQFRVWGSVGPDLPAVPKGWTEVRAAPDGLTAAAPSQAEQRRGYIVFARAPLAVVSPYARPFPSERATELRAFAARGEYEPLRVLIHALEPLDGVAVEASALRSAKDGLIPREHIDVRVARCIRVPVDPRAKTFRLEPFLLERRRAFAVAKGTTAQVWLTLKVPEAAEPGDYNGTLTLRTAGREPTQVALSLRVLPFALPPAPVEMAMCYPRPAASDELLLKELTDQREHGLNAVEPAMGVEVVTRDRKFGDDDVAAVRAHCKRMMDAQKRVFGGWHHPVTFGVGHQIAYYWDKGKNWFAFWPHGKAIEADLFKAIGLVEGMAKAEGWPPLRVYALDEAGAHNLLDEAVHYYRLIEERAPGLTTWTTIGGGMAMGSDEIGQLSPHIDFFSTNRFTPEIAQALVARAKPYGIYNGAGPTAAGARFFFGFWGWKTGAGQILQWVYHFGDAALRGNGLRRGDEGYVYLADDGPLPSPHWEAVREGADDYRYVHLLRQRIAAARAAGAEKAAEAAERALTRLLGQIGWGFQALNSAERTPPPHPSTLRKWRWAVAREILSLQQAGVTEAKPPARRASPLDLAWPTPEQEKLTYGEELLPPSGFEAAMTPWRVEAWNGKGQGALDAAEHHGGRRCVRIDVPAGSSAQAVTVLVWPSWGAGGLKLALEGDRTYELSAWAKWRGRGTPPAVRIALPPRAARTVAQGKDEPTPDGWQRLWARAEMSFPATPKYLAVWVQGAGTVWLDDLSLREARRPPVRLSLDQAAYDAGDRVAVAAVTVEKRVVPASVRFTLSDAAGKAVARLEAPFAPNVGIAPAQQQGRLMLVAPARLNHCELVFDPSTLAPGRFEARVELLGSRGDPLGSAAARFERLTD